MLLIPNAVFTEYGAYLGQRGIAAAYFTEYKKWLRYHLHFCDQYPVTEARSERVRLYMEKLQDKKQSEKQRERAVSPPSSLPFL
jgi:hypothetical protein